MKQEKLNFWNIPLGMLVAVAVLALIMCSCKSIEYVPVVENHTEHHWHTDSVKERDSTHTERETIIREVDSAAMAKYGIQMERNQRAWLVLQREMEARLRELEQISATKDTVHDSIPVPYPVEKLVEKQLSKGQMLRLAVGDITIFGVCGVLVFFAVRLWLSRKFLRL